MESKSDKFKRLAEKRTNEVIQKLRLIGNLARKGNYDYTDKQAEQLIAAIERELRALKAKFAESSGTSGSAFRFK